jgi:transposase
MDLAEALTVIELMRGQIAALEQQVCERDRDLRELRVEVELRGIEIARLRHALYGDKRERFAPEPSAPAEASTPSSAVPDATPGNDGSSSAPAEPLKRRVREHERAISIRGKRRHLEVDPARVRDEHRHLYPDARACRCCGAAMVEIGEETRVVIEHEPARFRRVTTHRHKMACAACKHGGVVIAQPDDPPASGPGMVGLSLAIEIALRHYADHLPFHRIAGIFERDGLRIDRATLSRVGGRVADALARIVGCMEAELLASDDVLGIDGTGIKILASPRCERRTIYVIHGRGHVVFRALDRADAEHVLEGFEGFCGVTVADAATVHTGSFAAALRVIVALCNAHARRKFHEARGSDPTRAEHVLRFYRRVAFLERSWADLDPASRQREREALLGPAFEALHAWALVQRSEVPARSPIEAALAYLLSHWEGLTRFLHDGRIPWTNNGSERLLRHVAVGRKAWMFRGSFRGARRACVLWSLMLSCRMLGIDPRRYLLDTLDALGRTPHKELSGLTPNAYAARLQAARVAA